MKKRKILTDIKMTRKAKARIDEIKLDNKDIFIRIMIVNGGCAGSQYYILMDDYIGDADFVLTRKKNGKDLVYIVIDEVSLENLHNSTIDFSDEIEFSGFKINNPNVKSVCDCGNSFNCNGGVVFKRKSCNN
jgi:iron-sulfur cluster assembly accessory protein